MIDTFKRIFKRRFIYYEYENTLINIRLGGGDKTSGPIILKTKET